MRFLSRHLQATLQDHVEAYLAELGWVGPADQTPLGALPVTYQRVRPDEDLLQSVTPNLVAASFGTQDEDTEEEMGGAVVSQDHVVFIDIYAENEGVALSLAEDVRDLFTGRASYAGRTASRFVQLQDQTQMPPTPVLGYLIELGDVVREPSPRGLSSVVWQIVTATATIYLPGA